KKHRRDPAERPNRADLVEKEVGRAEASLTGCQGEYGGRPAGRAARQMANGVAGRQSQARSPRTKRNFSGKDKRSVTARRVITQKSPLSTCTGVSAKNVYSR